MTEKIWRQGISVFIQWSHVQETLLSLKSTVYRDKPFVPWTYNTKFCMSHPLSGPLSLTVRRFPTKAMKILHRLPLIVSNLNSQKPVRYKRYLSQLNCLTLDVNRKFPFLREKIVVAVIGGTQCISDRSEFEITSCKKVLTHLKYSFFDFGDHTDVRIPRVLDLLDAVFDEVRRSVT